MTTDLKNLTDKEFFLKHKNLVHKVCQRYTPMLESISHTSGADYDDLFQIGLMGLLKSRERFDSSLGLKFSTYAVPMITGEIRRYLRDHNMVKTPRWIKLAHGKFKRLELENEDVATVAAALDMDESKAKTIIAYNSSHRSTSEVLFSSDSMEFTLLDTLASGFSVEDKVVNDSIVSDFLTTLDEREKAIWFAYHEGGLRQRRLAQEFGISQVQISRILTKIEAKATRYGKVKGYAKA